MPKFADPDLILRVRRKTLADGRNALEFEAKTLDPQLGLYFQPFDSTPFAEDPKAHFQELLTDIDEAPEDGSEEWLAGRGIQLFEEILPEELQRRLWAVRGKVRTVQILSDETWIPWELLKLQDPDDPSSSGPFLVEAFSLTRWLLSVPLVMNLPLRRIALVIPRDSGLPMGQEAEGIRLRALAGAAHEIIEVPATLHEVRSALESGSYEGWHFSGHGLAWNGSPQRWSITLEGREEFSPSHLTGRVRRLGKGTPLVFLNACHTGRGASSLTGMGGLASAFLKAGAGAFIGSLWSLHDDQAYYFAEDFYKHLFSGMEIGEAVQMARLALRERYPGSNNWLAYTVFAHPLARCGGVRNVRKRENRESEKQGRYFRGSPPPDNKRRENNPIEEPRRGKPLLSVFLCHASTDKPQVRKLYQRLLEAGVAPWLDEENLLPGQDWEHEIRGAVRRADVVIVCLSENSVTKEGFVQAEIRCALDVAELKPDGATFVIPLRLDNCKVPERLARWQWVDLFNKDGFTRLIRSLEPQALSGGRELPLTRDVMVVKSSGSHLNSPIRRRVEPPRPAPGTEQTNDMASTELRRLDSGVERLAYPIRTWFSTILDASRARKASSYDAIGPLPKASTSRRLLGSGIEYFCCVLGLSFITILDVYSAGFLQFFSVFLVFLIVLRDFNGGTFSIAKQVTQVRVVDLRTRRAATNGQAFLRNGYYFVIALSGAIFPLVDFLSVLLFTLFILLDVLMIIASPRGRRLGDLLARTQVVEEAT